MKLRRGRMKQAVRVRRCDRVGRKRKRASRSTSRRSTSKESKRTRLKGSSRLRIRINRAPLLILWVAVVAQREGYKFREGLTFGKAVAAIFGHARGRAIGRFKGGKPRGSLPFKRPGETKYQVMGMKVPGKVVDGEVHAVRSGKEICPKIVRDYLKRSFGPDLNKVKAALRKLTMRYPRGEIGRRAYQLYEKFRPRVPDGLKGWGAKGYLDLKTVKSCKL